VLIVVIVGLALTAHKRVKRRNHVYPRYAGWCTLSVLDLQPLLLQHVLHTFPNNNAHYIASSEISRVPSGAQAEEFSFEVFVFKRALFVYEYCRISSDPIHVRPFRERATCANTSTQQ